METSGEPLVTAWTAQYVAMVTLLFCVVISLLLDQAVLKILLLVIKGLFQCMHAWS